MNTADNLRSTKPSVIGSPPLQTPTRPPTSLLEGFDASRYNSFHKILTQFYALHDPKLVPLVDTMLCCYFGEEDEMMEALIEKYSRRKYIFTPQGKEEHLQAEKSCGGLAASLIDGNERKKVTKGTKKNAINSPKHSLPLLIEKERERLSRRKIKKTSGCFSPSTAVNGLLRSTSAPKPNSTPTIRSASNTCNPRMPTTIRPSTTAVTNTYDAAPPQSHLLRFSRSPSIAKKKVTVTETRSTTTTTYYDMLACSRSKEGKGRLISPLPDTRPHCSSEGFAEVSHPRGKATSSEQPTERMEGGITTRRTQVHRVSPPTDEKISRVTENTPIPLLRPPPPDIVSSESPQGRFSSTKRLSRPSSSRHAGRISTVPQASPAVVLSPSPEPCLVHTGTICLSSVSYKPAALFTPTVTSSNDTHEEAEKNVDVVAVVDGLAADMRQITREMRRVFAYQSDHDSGHNISQVGEDDGEDGKSVMTQLESLSFLNDTCNNTSCVRSTPSKQLMCNAHHYLGDRCSF